MNNKKTKNNKLLNLRNSNLELLSYNIGKEYTTLEFQLDTIICPAERPRTSMRIKSFYDPLSSYKNEFRKKIKNILPKEFKICKGEVEIHIEMNIKPPKSFTRKQLLYSFKNRIFPLVKPDNDNVEKNLFDILTKVIWEDDTQITFNSTRKRYSVNEYTKFKVVMRNESFIVSGRTSKEENIELEKIINGG